MVNLCRQTLSTEGRRKGEKKDGESEGERERRRNGPFCLQTQVYKSFGPLGRSKEMRLSNQGNVS